MGNSNVRSVPGTPTASPGADSPSEQSPHPLYKPHRKSLKSQGGFGKRQHSSGGSPSTPTEGRPGLIVEESTWNISKAGHSPPARLLRNGGELGDSSVFCSTPGTSGQEGRRARDSKPGVGTESPRRLPGEGQVLFQSPIVDRTGKTQREVCDESKEGQEGSSNSSYKRTVKNPKMGLIDHTPESQNASSVELSSSSGVYASPAEESADDYSSSSWNSAMANQDFMKLYWPNKVDRDDDPFQRASENLKEVSTEVSSLHLDLLGLLSRVDANKRTKVSGRGSPEIASAFRTQVKAGWEAPLEALVGESPGGFLSMAQSWESQLLGILQKVTASLHDLENLKGQNVSLIRDSVMSKSHEPMDSQHGFSRFAVEVADGNIKDTAQEPKVKSSEGTSQGNKLDPDPRVKELELDLQRLQDLLAKSKVERQQLEDTWLLAASEHQQEAACLRTSLQEQEAKSGNLAERVRTLEAERRKEQGLRMQAESGTNRQQDSLQRLEKEKIQLQKQISELQEKMQADTAEWRQFQSDLQTAVAVADDFKLEAEEQLAATREQLEEMQREMEGLRAELKQQQARRLGVDTIDRSRTLDGRKMPKTLTVDSSAMNGTSEVKASRPSGAVAPSVRDNIIKSSSLGNFSTQDKSLTVAGTREPLANTRVGERPTSPVNANQLTASDKWAEESEAFFRRYGGSKRGIFLRWCQGRTEGYSNVKISNFSSCWADGMALCALLHTYLPDRIPYQRLFPLEKKKNLTLAFETAESIGIAKTLTTEEMLRPGGPDWQRVLEYVESIYQHFET